MSMASDKEKLADGKAYETSDSKLSTVHQDDSQNDEPGIFKQRCMNILNTLQSCYFINSFDNEEKLRDLVLKFDNIKLRYAIWLRLNHKIQQKDYAIALDVLTRLDLFLFHEVESTYEGCAHGMIYHEENGMEMDHSSDEKESSPLYTHLKNHVEKYIAESQAQNLLIDLYNGWIVIDSSVCLSFLATIDGLIEELFTYTERDISLALAHGYASTIAKEMSTEALQLVQFSGFSDANLISQAARSRLRLQTVMHTPRGESEVTFVDDNKRLFVDTESLADSSEPLLTPTSSEASLEVEDRFARILMRSKESRNISSIHDSYLNPLAQRRILAELRQADSAPSFAGIACIDNSISSLLGIISGPPDTPYENGVFFIKIEIPEDYPLQAARFRFITKIHHPNINPTGQVCAAAKDTRWAISCSVWGLLTSIYAFLANPDIDDHKVNRKLLDATARDWTDRYAQRYWPTQDELLLPVPEVPLENVKSAMK